MKHNRSLHLLLLLLPACSSTPSAQPPDGGSSADAGTDAPGHDAARGDGATQADTSTPADGATPKDAAKDAAACTPAPGTMSLTSECDQVMIGILRTTGGSASVEVQGRLNVGAISSSATACTVVDSLDVVSSSGTTLATLEGAPSSVPSNGSIYPLASGSSSSALTALCNSDTGRFDALGLVFHGRTDGGSFTVKCGDNTPDTGWPPRVVVTCHTGLDAMPQSPASGMVMTSTVMGMTVTEEQLFGSIPQPPVVSSIDGTVHIVPQNSPFGMGPPLMPKDTTGWTGATSTMKEPDGTSDSDVELFNTKDVLGTDLCPPGCAMPPCGVSTPPVFLARIQGTLTSGMFESELYVSSCTRAP